MKNRAQRQKWTARIASASRPALALVFGVALASQFNATASNGVASACASVSQCSGVRSSHTVLVRLINGRLQTSVDSAHWTDCSLAVRTFFRAVTHDRGLFVAVGGSYFDEPGVIVTSSNGTVWTRRSSGTKNNLYSVAFGHGSFIAVGDSGAICTSEDGVVWKARRSGTGALLAAVAAGNNLFVVGGESGAILTSTNGVNWRSGNISLPIYVNKIAFRAGEFVIVDRGTAFTSSNGLAWQRRAFQPLAEVSNGFE